MEEANSPPVSPAVQTVSPELQTVYVLTNPAMPDIVKIGMTKASDVAQRIAELGKSTSVPLPFDCVFACNVPDARKVEQALHRAFAPDRINPSREFFKTKPDQVIAILKLLHQGEEVTAQVEEQAEAQTDPESLASAASHKRKMRPKINYLEIGLQVGDTITFKDGVATATIAGPHTVNYQGEESSLQRVSLKLMPEIVGRGVASKLYWTFNGKSLEDMHEEFHGDEE
ncbi:GIY-YIG nuclease family protein [Variovorax rhizosphaerae]|uniref:GIY-YIG nuclease family protein n=1 Tax=Variovorax rhizosphaerae TaxID=1836200 RepID=A0ABU8WF85_9BURK